MLEENHMLIWLLVSLVFLSDCVVRNKTGFFYMFANLLYHYVYARLSANIC